MYYVPTFLVQKSWKGQNAKTKARLKNILVLGTRLLEFVQDLNFRLRIQTYCISSY